MKAFNSYNSRKTHGRLRVSKLNLLLVIVVILLIAGYLIINNYIEARKIRSITAELIREQQLKHRYLSAMFSASRDRSLILLKMATKDDPFDLDDLKQSFSEKARLFIGAREKLVSLRLNENEKRLLENQKKLIRLNEPRQNQIAELFIEGKRNEALKLLLDQALPGQNEVLKQISLMLDEYNTGSIGMIESMNRKLEANTYVYMIFGVLLLAVGSIAIIIILTRISRKEEQQLSHLHEELSKQKFALDMHAMVAITALDGSITYANEHFCKRTGYSRDELIGQNHRLLDSGKRDKAYWKEMYRTINSGKAWADVICNKAKDGKLYWVETTIVPFMGKDNRPRNYISIQTDITEQKQADMALRRSQKMDALGQLTGGIAHDFNNILNIILGNLELLQRKLSSNEGAQERIQNIIRSTRRAADLTRKLLSFSRHQAENLCVININQLIDGMRTLITHAITPQIKIKWQLSDDLWLTEINPGDFEDSLLNLVINARDAMSSNACLTIATGNITADKEYCMTNPDIEPGNYVMLTVKDCGKGMTAEQLEHIFEPFYTTKERGKGTGLGLAMVFGFIQRSDGYIKVESEQDVGTTFRIYLPKTYKTIKISRPLIEGSSVNASITNKTILVVDDEEALQELAAELLTDSGYKVLTAENAGQALEILANEASIDLMISDVIMPGGMNGYDLAKQVAVYFPEIKILLTSGYTEKNIITDKDNVYTSELLIKPYTQTELIEKVSEILATDRPGDRS